MQPALIENTAAVNCSDCIRNMEPEMVWSQESISETRQMEVVTNIRTCSGASKPGLQGSTFLRQRYTGSVPSPAYHLFGIEMGGRERGRDALFLHSGARCPLKCQTSYSGNRRAERGALGLCAFSLTQRNLNYLFVSWHISSRRIGEYSQAQHRSELCRQSSLPRGWALALNFLRLRLFSHSPEEGAQHKRVYLLTSLPLPMCLTESGLSCCVLQNARLCFKYLQKSYCDSGEGIASAKILIL